jgi:hypothetical protein
MAIDALHLDLSEVEAEITTLLGSAVDVNSSGQLACEQFGILLANVVRSLPGNRPIRYWELDDLSCDSADRISDLVTLQGTCNWLTGGDGCDRFRLDIALASHPLLYSCKFTHSVTGEQILYVGKTPEGLLINGP